MGAPPPRPVDRYIAKLIRQKIRVYGFRRDRDDLAQECWLAIEQAKPKYKPARSSPHYNSIPQKHWRMMSGRQTKVINEQADRYGLPFGGPFIDLPKLARALHDFLADNALKLAKEEDELMQGGAGSPALERYREERALLARLDRLEREGLLVPRDQTRLALGKVAGILRGAGDALQRQFGTAAVEVLYEALDDAQAEIERSFGDGNGHSNGDGNSDGDTTDKSVGPAGH